MSDLSDIKKALHQFRSLDSKDPRYRDRLAFTNGIQAALRERLSTHSARIQQFLAGVNVATFSRIERNTEAHLLSLSDIRARLDEIHRDMRAGRRDKHNFQTYWNARFCLNCGKRGRHLTVAFSAAPLKIINSPRCMGYDHYVDLRSKQPTFQAFPTLKRCREYEVSTDSWKEWQFGDLRSARVKACLVKINIPKGQYYAASSQHIAILRKNTDNLDGVSSEGVFFLKVDLPKISGRHSSWREDVMYAAVGNERGTWSYFVWVNSRRTREVLTGPSRDNIVIRFCPVE